MGPDCRARLLRVQAREEMSWIGKLLGQGGGEVVTKLGGIAERFAANHLGKKEMILEMKSRIKIKYMVLLKKL